MVRCKHIRVGAKYNITRLILKQTRKAKNTKKRRVENKKLKKAVFQMMS